MTKKTIKLNESELRKMIFESVKKVLKEGGHLTWKDENGRMNTNSTDTWHGVKGSTFVWHGDYGDPEIYFNYNGEQYVLNGTSMEDILWSRFHEYCKENNIKADEHVNDDVYEKFARENAEDVLLEFCKTYY